MRDEEPYLGDVGEVHGDVRGGLVVRVVEDDRRT
jgi:hypothetical protein